MPYEIGTPGGRRVAVISQSTGEATRLANAGAAYTAAPTTGNSVRFHSPKHTIQVVLTTSSGNGSGTLIVEGTNDGVNYVTIATTTFTSGACPQVDGYSIDAAWSQLRSRCTAISGSSAAIDVWVGE